MSVWMVVAMTSLASATTWTVDDDGIDFPTADFSAVQDAIDAADDGDEILVYPGTYQGTQFDSAVLDPLGKSITIQAVGSPEETVLDGQFQRGVVDCENGETSDTILIGFKITRGHGFVYGGGIYCQNSSPSFRDCLIDNNRAQGTSAYGGGVYCQGSDPTFLRCIITNNDANGGSSTFGGGISCHASSPTFEQCLITNNTANIQGGGLYAINGSNVILTQCTVSENTAGSVGGGLFSLGGGTFLIDTDVCGNVPDQTAVAVFPDEDSCVAESCDDLDDDGVLDACDDPILVVPTDYPTIQAAIDAAVNGDMVLVLPGTYTDTGDAVINTNGKAITVMASGTIEETILDGQGQRRVIECNTDETQDTIIQGFTITNGHAITGGGMYCHLSDPTVLDCLFTGNNANGSWSGEGGGGLYGYATRMTLDNCTFTDNTAVDHGGGIFFTNSQFTVPDQPELTNCTISNNSGSGILCRTNCSPILNGCTITNNSSRGIQWSGAAAHLDDCLIEGNAGHGIWAGYNSPGQEVGGSLTNCLIQNNNSSGIYLYCGEWQTIITDCQILNNATSGVFDKWGDFEMHNCVVSGHTHEQGCGVIVMAGNATLDTCTITDNHQTESYPSGFGGGGIYLNSYAENVVIANCILSDNTSANNGGGLFAWGYTSLTMTNSVIQDNTSGLYNPGGGLCIFGDALIKDCTMSGNSAMGDPDGIILTGTVRLEGNNTISDPIWNYSGTMDMAAESICLTSDIEMDAFGNGYACVLSIDIENESTTAPLQSSGTLIQDGCLTITNDSGSLLRAVADEVIPIVDAATIEGGFYSVVFPVMPSGLALQLTESNAARGGGNGIEVEVVEIDTPDFNDPFSGELDTLPVDLVALDADGDGDEELAVLFPGSPGSIAVYDISEDVAPAVIPGLSTVVGNGPVDMDSGDLNGDGRDDLLVANGMDDSLTMLLSTGSSFTTTTIAVPGGAPTCVAALDWNANLDLDAVVGVDIAGTDMDRYQIVLDLTGSSTSGPAFSIPKYEVEDDIYESDPPMAVTGDVSSTWGFAGGTRYGRIHRANQSSGGLELAANFQGNRVTAILADDLDENGGDGQIDLAASSDEAESLFLLPGNASEPDGLDNHLTINVAEPVEDFVALDADGDGDTDFIITSPTSANDPLLLLRNDGSSSSSLRALVNTVWSKQALDSSGSPGQLGSGTLDPKDEEDDWVVGSAPTMGLRGEGAATMEQTNLLDDANSCPEDVDGNNEINIDDLLAVISAFGGSDPDADVDDNGTVNIDDLLAVISAFGTSC